MCLVSLVQHYCYRNHTFISTLNIIILTTTKLFVDVYLNIYHYVLVYTWITKTIDAIIIIYLI